MNSVLVTGGTGGFGRAFVRRLLDEQLADRICIYSRGEHTQAAMRDEFEDDHRLRWFIGDVRDRDRLTRAMHGCDTVIHAAALKRIEVGQHNPAEMVKTNIIGTMNVIEAAIDAGVERGVYLSSDKAYQPVSPYGQSKALAESLIFSANLMHGTRWAITRYGNVWASPGSVVHRWRNYAPSVVTMTNPDCTRFFMWMREAVDLVLDAADAEPGSLLIPELPAYRLGDLAEAMGLKMLVTGLPPYEKKHESMRDGLCSEDARRMTIDELREALKSV
jgi:UDP-N-acetylglucosamine 4,6-dehydratase/5-epimerase